MNKLYLQILLLSIAIFVQNNHSKGQPRNINIALINQRLNQHHHWIQANLAAIVMMIKIFLNHIKQWWEWSGQPGHIKLLVFIMLNSALPY